MMVCRLLEAIYIPSIFEIDSITLKAVNSLCILIIIQYVELKTCKKCLTFMDIVSISYVDIR